MDVFDRFGECLFGFLFFLSYEGLWFNLLLFCKLEVCFLRIFKLVESLSYYEIDVEFGKIWF